MAAHGRRTGGLTRRDVLKLAGAAGATAGLGRWTPVGGRQATLAGERPTLRVGITNLVESLDPHLDFRNIRALVTYSVFDGLLARDFLGGDPPGSGSAIVPGLATAWERPDDVTLELTLRDGVTFHDGSPLTSEDVKFSLDRVLAGEENPQARSTLGPIAGVEVLDHRRLRITTTAPDPILEKRLTTYPGWIVSPRRVTEAGDAFGQQPAGTGPYRVVEFRPDDALILEAHDAYWGGLPPAARIEFRVMPEPAARIAALVSGEVDLVNDVPPDQVATLATEEGVEVRGIPVGAMRILYYNTRHPVLADRRFRQGLNAAIDRELIIASLWNGQAVLPRGFQFPDFGNLYNADRPAPVFDPERARRLIQESGYDGQPVSLWFPVDTFTLDEAVTQAVVEMWREVGIDARPQSMTLAEHWDNPDQKPAIHTSNGNEFADPESWWLRWGDESTVGRLFWTPDDPRFYELGHQARTTLDQQTRYAAYQQMLDIWEEEAPGTVLHIPTENYGVRQDIAWQPYGFYYLDLRPNNLSF